ncbi:MAG TPA: 5-(carboxyamino)imidazole ribonucleotide mutase [Actinomycetota bacterium]|nr:5-(carboxyamino)imidazole ribonucleotide mutase [Actinomycetota bacterium]
MSQPFVAILMGSESDMDVMKRAHATLEEFGVQCEINVRSAHRQHEALMAYIKDAETREVAVYICGAGMAAALPGVVAAASHKPVIGVPIQSGGLGGLDSLLAIAQMPKGVPVACVAVNGAQNAALLAVQIMAAADPQLAERFADFRRKQSEV